MNQFCGTRRHDSCADEDAFFVGDDFDKSIAEIAGVGASDDIERGNGFADLQVAAQTIILGQADGRDIRMSKYDVWCTGVIRHDFVFGVDVMRSDAAFQKGSVRMTVTTQDIASSIDMFGAGLEIVVDRDAFD